MLADRLRTAAITGTAFIPEQGEQVHLTSRRAGALADLSDVHGIALALARKAVASDANDDNEIRLI